MRKQLVNLCLKTNTTNDLNINSDSMDLIKGKKLLTLIALAVLISACENGDENGQNANDVRLMPVETVTVEKDRFEDFIRLTGTVEAIDDATISAETSGRILSIRERGERVRQGEVIARLDDRLIQAQYEAARTGFELADDTFNRLEALYADSIISTQDFNSARAQRDQARAQLDQARKQLQDANISAPFNGRIEERMIRTGELINPGMPVVRLVNTDRVRILSGIPERYSAEIREGNEVVVNMRDAGGSSRTSRISYAGNVIDPDTRTYTIEVELTNPEQLIKPEMVVDLRVKRALLEDVVIVPRTAIVRDETGVFVFVAKEENGRKVAELQEVRIGTASGPLVQILEGISDGDEVVVAGMRNLSIGDELNILRNESSITRAERLRDQDRPVANL
jgi:membrane fusion protein, multidrug efflux system